MARYRPNILVGGGGLQPFAEDAWQEVALGPHRLTVDGAWPPSAAEEIRLLRLNFLRPSNDKCLSRVKQLPAMAD